MNVLRFRVQHSPWQPLGVDVVQLKTFLPFYRVLGEPVGQCGLVRLLAALDDTVPNHSAIFTNPARKQKSADPNGL